MSVFFGGGVVLFCFFVFLVLLKLLLAILNYFGHSVQEDSNLFSVQDTPPCLRILFFFSESSVLKCISIEIFQVFSNSIIKVLTRLFCLLHHQH